MAAGDVLCFDELRVEAYAVPHDCAEPLVFVFEAEKKRYGHFTDLGTVPEQLKALMPDLDALVLEANYDVQMLAVGPYPWPLKKRISGGRGHLSNDVARDIAQTHSSERLKYWSWVT